MDVLGKRGFRALYDKCDGNANTTYYQTGLQRVHLWSSQVIDEDINFVRSICPDVEETYEACFVRYVSERYRGQKQRPTVRCPPMQEFARRYLESLGQHDSMISGDYFSRRDPLTTKVACMDAARQSFYTLVTTENVKVELESQVGVSPQPQSFEPPSLPTHTPTTSRMASRSDAASQASALNAPKSNATQTRAPSVISSTSRSGKPAHSQPQHLPDAYQHDDVLPSDSVSQVGYKEETNAYGASMHPSEKEYAESDHEDKYDEEEEFVPINSENTTDNRSYVSTGNRRRASVTHSSVQTPSTVSRSDRREVAARPHNDGDDRHNFIVDEIPPSSPPRIQRQQAITQTKHEETISHASSGASSVRIGMKKVRSPR